MQREIQPGNQIQFDMKAEIINIGDEILIGQILNTNAQYIAEELDKVGFEVSRMITISDDPAEIRLAVDESLRKCDLTIITGGLGPTKDDLTKKTLAEYFNSPLEFRQELFDHVERLFKSLGRPGVPKASYGQAEVPHDCTVLMNHHGTAAGMWFERNGRVVISLPGVPYEMKKLMTNEVLPRLNETFDTMYNYHRTILTTGLGESSLMELIDEWEDSLEQTRIKLAYLPSSGRVRLRLSGRGEDFDQLKDEIDDKADELYEIIPDLIYGEENIELPLAVGELLQELGKSMATAESCTGGNIAHEITLVPGSSAYFLGGMVTYSNELKQELLGVSKASLQQHGAVSEQVVREMAEGAVRNTGADYALSVSGVAGPDGGSDEKPVGTVWIALAGKEGLIEAEKFSFGRLREQNIKRATNAALNMLRLELLKKK